MVNLRVDRSGVGKESTEQIPPVDFCNLAPQVYPMVILRFRE